MPSEDDLKNVDVEAAMAKAWSVIYDRIVDFAGNALTPAQMAQLAQLKDDYLRFWRKAQDDEAYEAEVAIVEKRIRLFVARCMLDGQRAFWDSLEAILDVAADLGFALIQRLVLRV